MSSLPIIDRGDIVGYVSRHTWSKDEIDRHNSRVRRKGGYRILRFRNSTENDFVKLLYNYDAVKEGVTDTVIITEGIFDVVALTRKKELYDNESMAAVATFGKKISRTQIYKLQSKGVKTVILGYDGDAVEAIKKTADELNAYFRVLIADIPDAKKDWEDLSCEEIDDIFLTQAQDSGGVSTFKGPRMKELINWLQANKISFKQFDNEVVEIEGFGKVYVADLTEIKSIFRGTEILQFNLMENPDVLIAEGICFVAFPFGDNWYYYNLKEEFRFNILKYAGVKAAL